MKLNKKTILLTAGILSITTLPLIYVACDLGSYDSSPYIGKDQVLTDDRKVIKYTSINEKFFRYLNEQGKNHKLSEVISSDDGLNTVLQSWVNNYARYERSLENVSHNLEANERELLQAARDLRTVYTKEWFKDNTLVIDYGGTRYANLEKIDYSFFNEKTKIKNLAKIEVVQYADNVANNEKEIEITYADKKYVRTISPVIYELKNKDFKLTSSGNYLVKKYSLDDSKVLKTERVINASSFLNIDVSKYNSNGWTRWNLPGENLIQSKSNAREGEEIQVANNSVATRFIKSKEELENLIKITKESYLKSNAEDNSAIEEFDKVITYFDSDFFKDNVLSILAVDNWFDHYRWESEYRFVGDYNADIVKNNVDIKLFWYSYVITGKYVNPKAEVKFTSRPEKYKTTPITLIWPDRDATLFMAISRNKFTNIDTSRINVSFTVNYTI
ncbi:hypothetical protein [Mycoplasmopsis agassizii]|uniref:Lipoprotein n=1 Tax=Mycoplasmopsis agassizii TaxID=33922 RepID=A0ABX4H4T5_9BACT|nr:hypothetical protein [Mycoplasmopsis agassizii]PAF54878.1 hypothetical protein CJF60_04035 [Mycoplasmopsis agassizii]SMC20016.1 hypothetical protein SAMN02745179_00988 [Mycoplasmopsis agassizii]